jgi:hypothetical protein
MKVPARGNARVPLTKLTICERRSVDVPAKTRPRMRMTPGSRSVTVPAGRCDRNHTGGERPEDAPHTRLRDPGFG